MSNLLLPSPKELWQPEFWTPSLTNNSRGEELADFAELFLTAERGFRKDNPLMFTDWQLWLVNALLEEKDDGYLRYRTALIGLPRKNGKSLIGTSLAIHALSTGPSGQQIYAVARNRQQARIVFETGKKQVIQNQYLSQQIKVYRDALENKQTMTVFRPLSADSGSAQGLSGSLIIADELHAWNSSETSNRGSEMWAALKEGSSDRPESLLVAITTAGGNQSSLLGKLYQHGKKVALKEIEDPSFGFFWWEAGEDADPYSVETWKKANPNLAEGLMDEDDFSSSIAMAGSVGFAEFQRYRLNQWVKLEGESFVSEYHWNLAKLPTENRIPLGANVVAGFDGSLTGDSTAIVIMSLDTGVFQIYKLWEDDGSDNWVVDRTDVVKSFHRLFDEYNVKLVWADDSYYSQDIYKLSKQYQNRIHKIPQNSYRIAPIAQDFIQDIVSGEIFHMGEEALTRHVMNALTKEDGSYRKDKRGSRNKIDLLACSVMANGARNYILKKEARNTGSALILK